MKLKIYLAIITIALVLGGAYFGKAFRKSQPAQVTPIEKIDAKQVALTSKILYQTDAGLILYDPDKQAKLLILGSDVANKLIDWDLSKDGKFLVYTLEDSNFDRDSSVWIKNLQTGNTAQIKKDQNVALLDANIFPDDKTIAYVKRNFDEQTKQLSDGEIWLYDMQNATEKKLYGDNASSIVNQKDLQKDGSGKACIVADDLTGAKIGIDKISDDGKDLEYWNSYVVPDCGGLAKKSQFVKIEGGEFLSQQLLDKNIFFLTDDNGQKQEQKWTADDIFWLENGEVVLSDTDNSGDAALFYFDKDQNKKSVIFDSTDPKFSSNGVFSQFFVDDIKVQDGKLILAYELYFDDTDDAYYQPGKFAGTKFYVGQFSLTEQIAPTKLMENEPYANIVQDSNDDISGIKILNNKLYYEKWNDQKQVNEPYIFDMAAKNAMLLN